MMSNYRSQVFSAQLLESIHLAGKYKSLGFEMYDLMPNHYKFEYV
jgi:hypothetical protein